MSTPAWRAAADHVMPFGKSKGSTLDDIAKTDDGLLYLDWLRGEMDANRIQLMTGEHKPLLTALRAYLDDAAIQRDLHQVMESRSR